MTSSRSKDVLLPIIGKARAEEFSQLKLPTRLEVLQWYIYFLKIAQTTKSRAANSTSLEAINLWKKVADGSTSNYTCYHHRHPVLIRFFLVSEGGQMYLIPSAIAPTPSRVICSFLHPQLNLLYILFDLFFPCLLRPSSLS